MFYKIGSRDKDQRTKLALIILKERLDREELMEFFKINNNLIKLEWQKSVAAHSGILAQQDNKRNKIT